MTQPPEPAFPFTPVVVRARIGGWSPAVQAAFVDACSRSGSFAAACRAVGRSARGARRLLARPDADSLLIAVGAALDQGEGALFDSVWGRALNGVERDLIRHGQVVGSYRKFDDLLTLKLLDRVRREARPRGAGRFVQAP